MGDFNLSDNSELEPHYPQVSNVLGIGFESLASEANVFVQLPLSSTKRHLSKDENLFQAGELKSQVFRVEAGIIGLSIPRLLGPSKIVETVLPGHLIGLGFIERDIYSAKAVVESCVSCWSPSEIPALLEESAATTQKQAESLEAEFAYRRTAALVRLAQTNPTQRLAAFLAAVSRLNEAEGRNPDIITDTLHCDVVASYLGIEMNALRNALIELESKALVKRSPNGELCLCDRERLDDVIAKTGSL